MNEKIGLDKFCDKLAKINLEFTDFILEDWEFNETEGNIKLEGLTENDWMKIYLEFINKHNFKK